MASSTNGTKASMFGVLVLVLPRCSLFFCCIYVMIVLVARRLAHRCLPFRSVTADGKLLSCPPAMTLWKEGEPCRCALHCRCSVIRDHELGITSRLLAGARALLACQNQLTASEKDMISLKRQVTMTRRCLVLLAVHRNPFLVELHHFLLAHCLGSGLQHVEQLSSSLVAEQERMKVAADRELTQREALKDAETECARLRKLRRKENSCSSSVTAP